MMSFWQHHGAFFLIFAAIFPRLTLLLATGLPAAFGVLGWIGWLLLPRFQIAYFATLSYADTNPFLVAVSWVVAVACLAGGGSETVRRVA